jgi:MFS family permease
MAIVAMVTFGLASQEEKSQQQNWVTILGNVPYFIFPLFLASLIDRSDRRKLLVWMDAYRALLILAAAFVISSETPSVIAYLLVFLVYAGTSIFFPAKSMFITELVSPKHLLRANSVSTTIGSLMALFGTLIGTRLVEYFGYTNTLLITVGAYGFSMLTLLMINGERQGQVRTAAEMKEALGQPSRSSFQELAEGWRVTRTNRVALGAVLSFAWIWGVVGAFFALLTAIIYERLAVQANRLGNEEALNFQGEVLGLVGIAMFVGGALVGRLGGRTSLPKLLGWNFAGAGATIILVSVPGVLDSVALTLTLFFLLGAFGGAILIPVETAIGKGVPREVRGRVFAFNTVLHTVILTGMMALLNLYLNWADANQIPGRLEWGLLGTGLFALAGIGVSHLLPRGVSLTDLDSESGTQQRSAV